jgi:hypothetical protein
MALAAFEFGLGRGFVFDIAGRRESHCSRVVGGGLLAVEES